MFMSAKFSKNQSADCIASHHINRFKAVLVFTIGLLAFSIPVSAVDENVATTKEILDPVDSLETAITEEPSTITTPNDSVGGSLEPAKTEPVTTEPATAESATAEDEESLANEKPSNLNIPISEDEKSEISKLITKPRFALQRHLYVEALAAINSRNFKRYKALKTRLEAYPLLPYLEYKYLLKHTSQIDGDTLERFISTHQSKRWAGYLQEVYLRSRLNAKDDSKFLKHFSDDVDDTTLACEHLEILYRNDNKKEALDRARKLWLSPFSMPKSCDRIFTRLIEQRGISVEDGQQRFIASFEKDEITLAKYLTRFLTNANRPFGNALLETHKESASFAKHWSLIEKKIKQDNSELWIESIYKIIKPNLRREEKKAIAFLKKYLRPLQGKGYPSAEKLWEKSTDYLILRSALKDLNAVPKLYKKLDQPQGILSYEWLARSYLHSAQWSKLITLIEQMPTELRQQDTWRYWRLRATQLKSKHQKILDEQLLAELKMMAKTSDFYGFAASQALDIAKQVNSKSLELSATNVDRVASHPNFSRAIEFYFHAAYSQANAEWNIGLKHFKQDAKVEIKASENGDEKILTAAYIANHIGWNNRAISTAARAKAWKHYAIRFPAAHDREFAIQSSKYGLPKEWFYATARQESALSPRAKSSAGALGLMQLMPATAKQQARKLGMPYAAEMLHEPSYNISLGASYLTSMRHRFQNKALASAAYNAGPHRVDQWLKTLKRPIPIDAWIETIRFNETRQYVKNVLSFGVIKDHLQKQSRTNKLSIAKHTKAFAFFEENEKLVYPLKKQVAEKVDF